MITGSSSVQQPAWEDSRTGWSAKRGWRFANGALWLTTRDRSSAEVDFNLVDHLLSPSDGQFWERGNSAAAAGLIKVYGANGSVATVFVRRRTDGGATLVVGLRPNGEVFTLAQ